MRRLSGTLILLASLAAGALAAAEPKVYKWTDENGTVHYSAEAPASGAQEVAIAKGPTLAPPAPAAAIEARPTPEESAKRCQQHRDNLKLLKNDAQPLTIEDKGTMRSLTGEERKAQVDAARAALTACEASPAPAPAAPPAAPAAPTVSVPAPLPNQPPGH